MHGIGTHITAEQWSDYAPEGAVVSTKTNNK